MRNQVAYISDLTNDANGICVDQTLADSGFLILDGALVSSGVGVISEGWGQKLSIEGTGDNSGITFTIVGEGADPGTQISEVLTGANNGTATSVLYYTKITSIYASGAITGNVEAGPLAANGAVSKSLRVNGQQKDFKLGLFVTISGTLTCSAQYAYQQPEDEYSISYSASADWRPIDGLSAITASAQSNAFYKVNAMRLLVSAYTSGNVRLTVTQSF